MSRLNDSQKQQLRSRHSVWLTNNRKHVTDRANPTVQLRLTNRCHLNVIESDPQGQSRLIPTVSLRSIFSSILAITVASLLVPSNIAAQNYRSDARRLVASIDAEISSHDEVDYYRLNIDESSQIAVYTTGDLDTWGALMKESAGGNVDWITSNDDAGHLHNFRIARKLEAGTYFVMVESFGLDVGDYTIHLYTVDTPADDHGDDRYDATELTNSANGSMNSHGDIDYFRINITPEARGVEIYTTGDLDMWGVLERESSGALEEIASDLGVVGNFRIRRTLDEAGTYYVKVGSHGVGGGNYSLHLNVVDDQKDDHSDLRSNATPLTSSVTGRIEDDVHNRGGLDDVDYFRIDIKEPRRVALYSTRGRYLGSSGAGSTRRADEVRIVPLLWRK